MAQNDGGGKPIISRRQRKEFNLIIERRREYWISKMDKQIGTMFKQNGMEGVKYRTSIIYS